MRKRLGLLVFVLALLVSLVPGPHATADASSFGKLGAVPKQGVSPKATTADAAAARPGDLRYHGGPVLPLSTAHALFWDPASNGSNLPSYPAGYDTTIEQYFTDVAADSGGNENVYSVGIQYFDRRPNGTIRRFANYDVRNGGSAIITTPFMNSCPVVGSYSHCISDSQIRRNVAALDLPRLGGDIFFVFLPAGVDLCFPGNDCAHNDFCAYHSGFYTRARKLFLYTAQPFADVQGCRVPNTPNANPADHTINVMSHEHRETINDPLGNAWFDRSGSEGSDKCAWLYGPPLGPDYNQAIGTHFYFLQTEWSNHSHACLQRGR